MIDPEKEKYIKCFEEIRKMLNRVDPAGLMQGCPDDEYDPEASRILITISKYKLKEEIIREISRDFKDSLGISGVGNLIGEDVIKLKEKYGI